MANEPKDAAAAPSSGTPGTALTAPVQSGSVPAVQAEGTQALPAMIRRNVHILRPIADAVVLAQVQNESRELIAKLLVPGRDFGTVPGVSKPSLFKPGAEKFNSAYGLVARFTVIEKEVDHYLRIEWTKRKDEWSGPKGNRRKETKEVHGVSHGLYRYVVNCELVDLATGEVRGSSLGSCSTLESKYVDRPRDLENTAIKMAMKRAYVGATLLTHGLSEQFTQDVEETGVASDDVPAITPQEPDPGPPQPEVGTSEWAITFPIPSGVHAGLKMKPEVQTFGQLTWPELESVIAGMERISTTKPEKKEQCALVIRAARRMQDELDERAAISADATDAGAAGAPANPTQGASAVGSAPTATTPDAGANVKTTTQATPGSGDTKATAPDKSVRVDQEEHAGLRDDRPAKKGSGTDDEDDGLPF